MGAVSFPKRPRAHRRYGHQWEAPDPDPHCPSLPDKLPPLPAAAKICSSHRGETAPVPEDCSGGATPCSTSSALGFGQIRKIGIVGWWGGL
ncbi:hypothetical protein E2562_007827 [Oryza meyeriana var. granulata]|uniref:Uncharacterized protein n=1 Tax=Oryza meyeriana var. granulata TaxID=110450 RepID=A0A6G1F539_9ORYZ|nr:hypothetical protein E2562_007827 [Oryza meyeriana var. granulata]